MALETLSRAPARASALPLGAILLRAALVATVIGSALTLLNQPSALFGPATLQRLPLVLVYLTPFVVVAVSQVLGIRQAQSDLRAAGSVRPGPEAFAATILGHGIPFRAGLTGLVAGSANTSLVIFAALLTGGETNALPLMMLAEAYALPMLFGALSQALAYRRTIAA